MERGAGCGQLRDGGQGGAFPRKFRLQTQTLLPIPQLPSEVAVPRALLQQEDHQPQGCSAGPGWALVPPLPARPLRGWHLPLFPPQPGFGC